MNVSSGIRGDCRQKKKEGGGQNSEKPLMQGQYALRGVSEETMRIYSGKILCSKISHRMFTL